MHTFTEEQVNSFRKLSDYLLSGKLKAKFNMNTLAYDHDRRSLLPMAVNSLNIACGCALGYGPLAGVITTDVINWSRYSIKYFGCNSLTLTMAEPLNDDTWLWCFSGGWYINDNTPEGAGKRIRWLLEHDFMLPEDHLRQRHGLAPLCY